MRKANKHSISISLRATRQLNLFVLICWAPTGMPRLVKCERAVKHLTCRIAGWLPMMLSYLLCILADGSRNRLVWYIFTVGLVNNLFFCTVNMVSAKILDSKVLSDCRTKFRLAKLQVSTKE